MIVVTKDAEKKLAQTLNINDAQNNEWRCVYIQSTNFLDFDLKKTTAFVYSNVEDQNGLMFVCEDGDIFIMARYIGSPFASLLQSFILTHSKPRSASLKELTILFEMRVDRHRVLKIIEKKLIKQHNQKGVDKKALAKQEHEKKRQEILNMPLPQNLIETLSKRRSEKETPEIFVVEDDPFSRKLIANVLPDSFNLSLVENGREALTQYFIKAPDIMFLDIGLPDIDGHDVLTKILEHDPDAYIVMLSGKGDKENLMKAIQNGAKGFVGKPFTRDKLFQYIEKSPHIPTLDT